jgi:hypothetical protein
VTAPATVQVTAQHLADGKPHHCSSCPVALAITDAWGTPAPISVQVGRDVADALDHLGRHHEAGLPPWVIRRIAQIDASQPVEPFSFRLKWRQV